MILYIRRCIWKENKKIAMPPQKQLRNVSTAKNEQYKQEWLACFEHSEYRAALVARAEAAGRFVARVAPAAPAASVAPAEIDALDALAELAASAAPAEIDALDALAAVLASSQAPPPQDPSTSK